MEARIAILKDAAKAGKAVLMQKPMATDLKTAEEMVKIAEDAGISFAVNQNLRFDPAIYLTKQFLARSASASPATSTSRTSPSRGPSSASGRTASCMAWQIHAIDSSPLAVGRRSGLDLLHQPEQRLHVSDRVLERGGLQLLRVSQRG